MTAIDDRIRDALSADDQAFLDGLEQERGLFAQASDMFYGPMGRWTILVYVKGAVLAGLLIWSVMQMLEATDLREQLIWMTAVLLSGLTIAMIKLWAWGRMQQLALLRELKRIELRVARIEKD